MLEQYIEALLVAMRVQATQTTQILIMKRNVIVAPVSVTVLKDTEVLTIPLELLERKPPRVRRRLLQVEKVILIYVGNCNFI